VHHSLNALPTLSTTASIITPCFIPPHLFPLCDLYVSLHHHPASP
jgi:hypothetical protein